MRYLPTFAVLAPALILLSCAASPHDVPVYRAPSNALGPYSASVDYRGLTFVAGRIGTERGEGVVFADEVTSAIDRVEEELRRAGLELSDCLSATVYLTDMDNYAELNRIYGPRFVPPPARACIAVKALPAGARVEIQVIAAAASKGVAR